jgi:hypothetical protein
MNKTDTKSLNVNQLVDISQVVNQFITIFYNLWISNPLELKTRGIIKHFSKIAYDKKIFRGDDFINLLIGLKQNGLQINITKFEFLDSGSRRIDISLIGTIICNINNTNITKNFNQTFLIANHNDKWYIHNSMLIIL